MSSFIDPITGVPYDALSSTLYSIPLNSQPALAPEWNPQGRITSTVYPDNLPTVFATLQAQNDLNPSTVQAATTDGAGNLNVNVKAGGSSGGGWQFPFVYTQKAEAPLGFSATQWDTLSPNPAHIYRVQLSISAESPAGSASGDTVRVSIGSYDGSYLIPLFVWKEFYNGKTDPNCATQTMTDLWFPGGMPLPATFPADGLSTIWTQPAANNGYRMAALYWWD